MVTALERRAEPATQDRNHKPQRHCCSVTCLTPLKRKPQKTALREEHERSPLNVAGKCAAMIVEDAAA
jgi:hypothetical protein